MDYHSESSLQDQHSDKHFSDEESAPTPLAKGALKLYVAELKAWIVRRQKVYKEQLELRDQLHKMTQEMVTPDTIRDAQYLSMIPFKQDRLKVLDNAVNEGSARAIDLLNHLETLGFCWPDLWWQPETDGGICSLLACMDEEFDGPGELTILEDMKEEERLWAGWLVDRPQTHDMSAVAVQNSNREALVVEAESMIMEWRLFQPSGEESKRHTPPRGRKLRRSSSESDGCPIGKLSLGKTAEDKVGSSPSGALAGEDSDGNFADTEKPMYELWKAAQAKKKKKTKGKEKEKEGQLTEK